MANRHGREALRGVEVQVLDLIAEVLTFKHWAELLKGPLERAARQGNRGLAQKLVSAGAQVGDALHEAVRGGHGEVVNNLLENGVSINTEEREGNGRRTPLQVAALEGRTEMVHLLMLKGADKDAMGYSEWTPLYSAVFNGHVAASVTLLAGGADVNVRCDEESVLHRAARRDQVDILRVAIKHGADVNAADILERTPLHHAIRNSRAINVLVEAGADIEGRCDRDWTPLMHAVLSYSSLEALSTLLKHGACVNAKTKYLFTPLHLAAMEAGSREIAEVVDVLLRSEADETIVDYEGKTAANRVAEGIEERLIGFPEDVARVRKLLENAPADRAWRRRGYLVLCRAHPDRVERTPDSSSSKHTGTIPGASSGPKLARMETKCCHEGMGGGVDEGTGALWARAVAGVLGLQEEGIFRAIVGYL